MLCCLVWRGENSTPLVCKGSQWYSIYVKETVVHWAFVCIAFISDVGRFTRSPATAAFFCHTRVSIIIGNVIKLGLFCYGINMRRYVAL
jgi:hypothetical protein